MKRSGKQPSKPALKCLNQRNVDVQNMDSKLIENHPAFVITSNQQSAETRSAWKTHEHEKMKDFIDAEEQAITTNSEADLPTLIARSIVKNISTEGPFPCGAIQDVEGAVIEGKKAQVSMDDMEPFVRGHRQEP